jgi:short-subunit dehydrogenase involved in D-alanine esterification of teichoic acids
MRFAQIRPSDILLDEVLEIERLYFALVQTQSMPRMNASEGVLRPKADVIRWHIQQAAVVLIEMDAPRIRDGNEEKTAVSQEEAEAINESIDTIHVLQHLKHKDSVKLAVNRC